MSESEGQEVEIATSSHLECHAQKNLELEQSRSNHHHSRRISCSALVVVKSVTILLLVTAGIVGLSLAFLGTANPIEYFVPVDPPGYTEAIRWYGYDESTSAGLYLTVENACDEDWVAYFDQSIMEWNETDALIANSVRTSHDYDCLGVLGRLRVCNGDYGNTDWRGINGAVISAYSGKIFESVSKLNDYHIKGSPMDMLYTMCHENGHGFGLPHTDDNHFNRDRGDCLDYTNSPENNLVPGQHNLDLLEKLYGTPDRPLNANATTPNDAETRTDTSGGQTPGPYYNNDRDEDKDEKDKDAEKDDRRHLGQQSYLRHGHRMTADDSTLQVDVDNDGSDDQAFLQESIRNAMDNCKHEHCVYDLNEKYLVRVQKLLAVVPRGAK